MAMSGAGVALQGVLGAIGGGAQAAAKVAHEQQMEEYARIREERLSKLRLGEYQARADIDLRMKDAAVAKERRERADFYTRTERDAPGKEVSTTYTDMLGDETEGQSAGGIINSVRQPTRQELAEYRRVQAQKTGNEKIIGETYNEAKDIRAEAEQARRTDADERRAATADRLATVRERDAATREQRLEAMIAGLIGRRGGDLSERKYSDKQWSDAKKELGAEFVIDDPASGKTVPDHAARAAATGLMRRLQTAGDIDPVDAATVVSSITARVTAKAREGAQGDPAKYQRLVAAGMEREAENLFKGQGGQGAPRVQIVDPFAKGKEAGKQPSAEAKAAPAPEPKSKGIIESSRMANKFQGEEREMQAGTRRKYSPEVLAWMKEQQAARSAEWEAGQQAFMEREQRRMLRPPGR